MGAILSFLWGNQGKTDDPDPTTGLTSRDKYILSTTWKTLSSGKTNLETGMEIFLNLFDKHPHYQQLFPFRGIPKDELKQHTRFHAHCISVMAAFSSLIGNIDSPEVLKELLLIQGVNHVPRKVPREAYEDLKQVLLGIFVKSMNEEELETWKKFLGLGFTIILQGADSVNKD